MRDRSIPPFYQTPRGACLLSLLLPGSGLALRGYPKQAFVTGGMALALIGVTSAIGSWQGPAMAVFTGMLLIPPWWGLQAFQASLPSPQGLASTWQIILAKGYDIGYLGGLFMVAAITDLSIILMNPSYQLHVFCTRPSGLLGILAKAQSPTFHVAIGYGFLRRRPWALMVYLLYAGYGLVNAMANYACEGYGRIRTVFFFTLLAFTGYVILRRRAFFPKASL